MPRGTKEKEYEKLGGNLRNMRVDRGVSQSLLAEKLGVSFQQVQKYESGENRIPVVQLILACRVLDCSIYKILSGVVR